MHRTKEGEHIKDIKHNRLVLQNYHKFNDREEMLPTDQHMLIAAMAPRLCYGGEAQARTIGRILKQSVFSCRMAGEAYALYGKRRRYPADEPVEINKAHTMTEQSDTM